MESLRHTALAVITAAVICGVITPMLSRGAPERLVRLLCGMFIAVSLISRIRNTDLSFVLAPLEKDWVMAHSQADAGAAMARQEMERVIKQQCEAYILDKAEELGTELRVDLELSPGEIPVPEKIRLYGKADPAVRAQLSQLLTRELGIAKEDQFWLG